jgi:hypothetical protein
MTDGEIHTALCSWLQSLTGIETIVAYDSGKAPAEPYIAVNLTGTVAVREWAQSIDYDEAEPDTGEEFGEVTARPLIETEWRFSAHAYGAEPTGILRPVRTAYQLLQRHEPMLPNLIIHEISQIRNVPDWLQERWVPRAQMDIILRGITRDGLVIDVIEEAPFDFERAH